MDTVDPHPSSLEWAEPELVTDDHLKTIARIILNWGQAESILGDALCCLYNIEPEDRSELIHVLDMRKKADYIKKRSKKKAIAGLDKAFTELNYCISQLKQSRDIIAHGMIMHAQNGAASFVTMKGPTEVPLSELPNALTHSRYVSKIAKHILFTLQGRSPEPLPQRPL